MFFLLGFAEGLSAATITNLPPLGDIAFGAWGDFDNDGKHDVVLAGLVEGYSFTRIYRRTDSGPHDETCGRNANHCAHSLGLRVEGGVLKCPTDEVSCFVLPYCEYNQAALFMAEVPSRETKVARKKRGPRKREEKRKNLFVGHPFAAQLRANLPNGNPPTSQELALALQDVFVKNVHADRARLDCQLVGVLLKRFASQAHRFGDR